MSRRDSRLSLNVRQNDALSEFENFKKKFLLANKHITKLNSTLSVRIEELNAQISTLYVENLRLRASEIALAAQLKKEQEKSRKIMADADAATANLVKHLTFLRQSFGIAPGVASPAKEKPASRARRPLIDPNASPQMPKLSRAPNVPGIYEDEELTSSPQGDEEEAEHIPSPTIRRKTKSRLAASRLPLPARVSSPPPLPTPPQAPAEERGSSNKRRTGRREGGFLSVSTDGDRIILPRAASPAFGSPARREAGLAEDDEEQEAVRKSGPPPTQDDDLDYVLPAKKEKEKKTKQVERELPSEEGEATTSSRVQERKRRRREEYSGLKDVTNSPRSRAMLPLLNINAPDRDRQHTPDTDGTTPISGVTSLATTRSFLSTPATTPTTTSQIPQLPTPRTSFSPVPPPCASTSEEAPVGGRERRTRKSVNYAEPKLNTKMRKPDGPPMQPTAAPGLKKRSSTTSVQNDDPEHRPSSEGSSQSKTSIPVARSSSGTSSSSSATANTVVKRKKSRPHVEVDDDESEGAQADAEYGNINGWVNVEGRRRSAHQSAVRRALEADDGRRHSLAV
ncbi:uncharacterized protein F5891DRAFT_1035981 [Suillus fuscotomentosus]|uniref:Shugoshin C-terminal domain-containing protein n=1 Tax=Suillus fuscotomentosus TaxID=1912939 RepID=A0AAD4E5S3_9AGAM|nr:uncharacterized protein F5891DRAFT_1035981 [Suillus fuscotomentosus]KAG1900082.1 hypothetical protein F5891DRAFT_1035981 [Suillus fuscotomentosus]